MMASLLEMEEEQVVWILASSGKYNHDRGNGNRGAQYLDMLAFRQVGRILDVEDELCLFVHQST